MNKTKLCQSKLYQKAVESDATEVVEQATEQVNDSGEEMMQQLRNLSDQLQVISNKRKYLVRQGKTFTPEQFNEYIDECVRCFTNYAEECKEIVKNATDFVLNNINQSKENT